MTDKTKPEALTAERLDTIRYRARHVATLYGGGATATVLAADDVPALLSALEEARRREEQASKRAQKMVERAQEWRNVWIQTAERLGIQTGPETSGPDLTAAIVKRVRAAEQERDSAIAASAESARKYAESVARIAELKRRIEHSDYFYATRFERLSDWARSLAPELSRMFFDIVANGTAVPHEPPTYAQQMNMLRHERDALAARVAELEGALHRDKTGLGAALAEIAKVVKGYGWIGRGEWGPYADEERTAATLRAEATAALKEIGDLATEALAASGKLAQATMCPAAPPEQAPRTDDGALRERMIRLDTSLQAGAELAAAFADDAKTGSPDIAGWSRMLTAWSVGAKELLEGVPPERPADVGAAPEKMPAGLTPEGTRVHALKTWPEPFALVASGVKTFEVRKFDRDYRIGDRLDLEEWDPATGKYTWRMESRFVSCIVGPGKWGLPSDVGVLGLAAQGAAPATTGTAPAPVTVYCSPRVEERAAVPAGEELLNSPIAMRTMATILDGAPAADPLCARELGGGRKCGHTLSEHKAVGGVGMAPCYHHGEGPHLWCSCPGFVPLEPSRVSPDAGTPAKFCKGDVCEASKIDGVICTDDECDYETGVRSPPEPLPNGEPNYPALQEYHRRNSVCTDGGIPPGGDAAVGDGGTDGVLVDYATQDPSIPSVLADSCPKCGATTISGYGLAGGGIGAYSMCSRDGCDWMGKVQDETSGGSSTEGGESHG